MFAQTANATPTCDSLFLPKNLSLFEKPQDPIYIFWEDVLFMKQELLTESRKLFSGRAYNKTIVPFGLPFVKATLEQMEDGRKSKRFTNGEEKKFLLFKKSAHLIESHLILISEILFKINKGLNKHESNLEGMNPVRKQLTEDMMGIICAEEIRLMYYAYSLIQEVTEQLEAFTYLQETIRNKPRYLKELFNRSDAASLIYLKAQKIEARIIKSMFESADRGNAEQMFKFMVMLGYTNPLNLKDTFGIRLENYSRNRKPIEDIFTYFK